MMLALCEDNWSAKPLEINGMESSRKEFSKQTSDVSSLQMGLAKIKFCLTNHMIANLHAKFHKSMSSIDSGT